MRRQRDRVARHQRRNGAGAQVLAENPYQIVLRDDADRTAACLHHDHRADTFGAHHAHRLVETSLLSANHRSAAYQRAERRRENLLLVGQLLIECGHR
jgi:hypothetical protein